MPSPTAKRALFTSPMSRKRAKTTTLVVRAKTENKFEDTTHTLTSGTRTVSLISPIFQGDGVQQRIGSKLRVLAVEARYDFASNPVFNSDACVIRLVIPKDPSATVFTTNVAGAFDPTQFVVVHEEYLTPGSNMSGMFRWKGPLNCSFAGDGNTVLKNNLHVQIRSSSGASSADIVCHTRVWYSDP